VDVLLLRASSESLPHGEKWQPCADMKGYHTNLTEVDVTSDSSTTTYLYYRTGTSRIPIADIGILRGDACNVLGKAQRRDEACPVGWSVLRTTYSHQDASLGSDGMPRYLCYTRQISHPVEEAEPGLPIEEEEEEEAFERVSGSLEEAGDAEREDLWTARPRLKGAAETVVATRRGQGWKAAPADQIILRAKRMLPTIPDAHAFAVNSRWGVEFYGRNVSTVCVQNDPNWCLFMFEQPSAVIAESGSFYSLEEALKSLRGTTQVPDRYIKQDLRAIRKTDKYDNGILMFGPDENGNSYAFKHSKSSTMFYSSCKVTVTHTAPGISTVI